MSKFVRRLVEIGLVAALLPWSSPLLAGGLPPFEAAAPFCRAFANGAGDKVLSVEKGCLMIERPAYDRLATRFATYPAIISEECLIVVGLGGGISYLSLEVCLEERMTES